MQKSSIILVGLSYTGKTTVGQALARRLGWPFKDTDDLAVSLAGGKPVPDIFREWGEERFRGLEQQALGLACSESRAVIATGGGAVLDGGNRVLMSGAGVVYWLDARPQTIVSRLQAAPRQDRPLLAGDEPTGRLEAMRQARLPSYTSVADWIITTDVLTPDEVADEVLRTFGRLRGRLRSSTGPVPGLGEERGEEPSAHASSLPSMGIGATAVVSTSGGSYPVFVGSHVLNSLPNRMRNLGLAGRVFLVSDHTVAAHYGERAAKLLTEGGFSVSSFGFRPGEPSKDLSTVAAMYDWLTEARAERGHTIVALGGGVVGDMAGFVAATYLRGMACVQVPTTLLAMVDASIGGKTGVNRPAGKNLVGSFYQPRMVVSDVELLRTLGPRELAEGWAEALKTALIWDSGLLEYMEANGEALSRLEPGPTTRVVAATAAIKADVVSQDERESGLRAILNYGHTIGHGLEAATGYDRYLHGEAVAVGMMGAARLSEEMGLLTKGDVQRQRDVLHRFGLPLRCPGVPAGAIRQAMGLDKKVLNSRQRWVLLDGVGRAVVRDDVPDAAVDDVLRDLTAAEGGTS